VTNGTNGTNGTKGRCVGRLPRQFDCRGNLPCNLIAEARALARSFASDFPVLSLPSANLCAFPAARAAPSPNGLAMREPGAKPALALGLSLSLLLSLLLLLSLSLSLSLPLSLLLSSCICTCCKSPLHTPAPSSTAAIW